MSTPSPKMPRAMGRADGANDVAQSGEQGEPSAAELAEALFRTIQALKSTGRVCAEEADPALRAISMPRGRVLEAFAGAESQAHAVAKTEAETESGEGGANAPVRPRRGRGRRRFHEGLRAHAERGRVRMGDLAAALGVTARNVTTIVDGLEDEGLLTRLQHPTDRRVTLLELTEKGRAHIAQIHALHHAIAERFFAPLDGAERGELLRLLAKVQAGASGAEGASGHRDTP